MNLVETQDTRELRQGPLPVGSAVDLTNLPVEAVVEEAGGQVEAEVALQGLLDLLDGHAIVEDSIEDGLADLVVVVGLGFDVLDLGAERSAAVAGGTIFGGGDMKEEDGLVGDGADGAVVESLAWREPGRPATVRAGSFLGGMAAVGVKDLGAWVGVGVEGKS